MAALWPAERSSHVRSILRLAGPAFAVGIGYIDPGNWASDIAAGAFGMRLLWVVLVANAIAIVLQIAVTRVTLAYECDLASLIGRRWPRLAPVLWFTFQGAAIATDLAEFTGIVLGLQLLLGIATLPAVAAGLVIVGALLALGNRHRSLDLFVVGSIVAMGLCFGFLVIGLRPDLLEIARGAFVPTIPSGGALFVVVAIVGATVMPHNLFLHSSLVNERYRASGELDRTRARGFFASETFVALNLAMLINAAILIVGAVLHARSPAAGSSSSINAAFEALSPHAGSGAAILFGSALLVSGIAASLTATLSGDYIFAALAPIRVSPAIRRAVTLVPAGALLALNVPATALLLWSQVALCLILPIVLVPLLALLYRRNSTFFAVCVVAALLCVILDIALFVQTIFS